MTLSPNSRAMLSDIEKSIKDKYMTKVKEMSATELKAFNKHKCMKQMVEEIEILFPRVNPKFIADGCLPISNAAKAYWPDRKERYQGNQRKLLMICTKHP